MQPTVITMGESMLRLSPANGRPLESSDNWMVDVAGAESNVAVALARLGVPTGWVSRLPDSALGRKVAHSLRFHGVDISRVLWSQEGRLGLYFLDPGASPRSAAVTYDRSNSAMAGIEPEEADWDYIREAKVLHLTGITPALGPGPRAMAERAIAEVQGAGGLVCFDLNYRARLWGPAEARAALEPLMARVDLLIVGRRDAALLFPELQGADEAVVQALADRFQAQVAVLTCEADGAMAVAAGQICRCPAVLADCVDRVGRGDAFTAGFLHGYLKGGVKAGLAHGTALAALKMTYSGDFTWSTESELERVLAGGDARISR